MDQFNRLFFKSLLKWALMFDAKKNRFNKSHYNLYFLIFDYTKGSYLCNDHCFFFSSISIRRCYFSIDLSNLLF